MLNPKKLEEITALIKIYEFSKNLSENSLKLDRNLVKDLGKLLPKLEQDLAGKIVLLFQENEDKK